MRKRRLHGREISAPAPPTARAVKDSWKKMVEKGELSLGVPSAPFTLSHYSITNGKLEEREITVTGRMFSSKDLRKKLLANQERYMRHAPTDRRRS